ncbi:PAS domain S-box protein [Methanolobus sp. WCC4]|uniref:PAS domain S-box protein n=1 Tax=Methanolobus sp. WCC4 TaxID=3125784 RepID=UPI0030FA0F62
MSGINDIEGFHRKILNSIWIGVWAVDRNENITFFNKGMEYIFRTSGDRVLGTNVLQYIKEQSMRDQKHFCELFCRVKRTLKPAPYDSLSMITRNGSLTYQSGVLVPLIDDMGNYDGMVGTVEDITERKLIEKQTLDYLKTEKELENIYKSSPVIAFLWLAGDNRPVEYVSDNIHQFGYIPEDFTSGKMDYSDMIYPDDLGPLMFHIRKHEAEGNDYFSQQYRILTKKGNVRWVSERSLIVRDENDVPAYHQGIVVDITVQKRSHEALLEAEKKYRLIFENSPLGIFDFDKEGIVRHCNDSLIKILGLPKEEIIGFNLMTSLRDEKMKAAFESVLSKNSGYYEGEYRSTTVDKTTPIRACYSPNISEAGSIVGGIGIIEDITERKKAEEALKEYTQELARANEELKSLDRMKDEFLSNVSHELNTPIVSIKGYSTLVCDGTLGDINDKQKDALMVVLRNTQRLIHVVNSLLYISMIQTGSLECRFEDVSISDIIDNVTDDMMPLIRQKGLSLQKDIPADLPSVRGDREKLALLFTDLLDNAIKFNDPDGQIILEAEEERQEGKEEQGTIHIRITDTGIGIPEELIPKIFQRFYQVDSSAKRKYGGTGLGLYVSKSIVDEHKGRIWIESEKDAGTTVHVMLPEA